MENDPSRLSKVVQALSKLNHPRTIIVIGRANSGTRILPEAMQEKGIYFGEPLNIASDLLPSQPLFAACREFGPHVNYLGKHQWNFDEAVVNDIPERFYELLADYLQSLLINPDRFQGFKIPNSNLIYPWLVRVFPEAQFIHWIRHPEGACRKMAGIDRLEKWNIPCKKFLLHDWNYKIKVVSWKYHFDIVAQTPKPKHFLRVRYEDYILHQNKWKDKVALFIDHPLGSLDLDKAKAGPYTLNLAKKYPILAPSMESLGYT